MLGISNESPECLEPLRATPSVRRASLLPPFGSRLAATQAAQMAMPGMRFHALHGDRYSVWVNENYRVTFRFHGGHASEVDYEDYHCEFGSDAQPCPPR